MARNLQARLARLGYFPLPPLKPARAAVKLAAPVSALLWAAAFWLSLAAIGGAYQAFSPAPFAACYLGAEQ